MAHLKDVFLLEKTQICNFLCNLYTWIHLLALLFYSYPDSPLSMTNVAIAMTGAARAKIMRCFFTRDLSNPSWSRNVVRPNAAGALCSMMARNTIT